MAETVAGDPYLTGNLHSQEVVMDWVVILRTLQALLELFKNPGNGVGRLMRSGVVWFVCGISFFWIWETPLVNFVQEDRDLHQNVLQTRSRVACVKNPFFTSLWRQRFERINADLLEINSGVVTIPADEAKARAEEMLRHVNRSLVATSTAADWWADDAGKRYEQQSMILATGGKVQVTRIFLYTGDNERNELKRHLEDQRRAGIVVLTAQRGKRLEDYVLIDDAFAGVMTLSDKAEIIDVKFYFDDAHVDMVRQRIAGIKSRAQLY
jgi:hypothetical protein